MTFDLDSLVRAAHVSNINLALGVSGQTVAEYRERGLSEVQADRFAVKLGLHPGCVWPEQWFNESPADVMFARLALERAEYLRRVS